MAKSKETKVHVMNDDNGGDKPNYSKVDKVYVMNPTDGGGGGGVADEVAWENVTGKPVSFPPAEHKHDDRYYTKEQIDAPEFMSDRVDNITVALEGRELKVQNVDGLEIGVADINEWLAGTSGNIQTQIDGLGDTITGIAGGMTFKGIEETRADLDAWTNVENGDVVVVLADETRDDGRSMYVYNDDLGKWDYIGTFTFTTEFTALSDTPNNYQSGKYLRSSSSGIIYDDVDYQTLKNKPESTITEIDSAVVKAHEHSNKRALDTLDVNDNGELTINGVVHAPNSKPKQRLYARRTGTEQPLSSGTTCVFNTKYEGEGIPYDTNSGVFTLEAGKTYRVFVTASINTEGFVILRLVTADSNAVIADNNQAIWMSVNPSNTNWKESSAGPLLAYITPTTTKGFKIRASSVSGTSGLRPGHCALEITEI